MYGAAGKKDLVINCNRIGENQMGNASIKKNTVYNIIKTASTILFPLITFPYISRVLQPENIGKINFGNSIVGYICDKGMLKGEK